MVHPSCPISNISMDELSHHSPTDRRTLPLTRNTPGRSIILTTLGMLALGVVMVHSALASVGEPGAWYARVDVRHTAFAVLAAVVLVMGWRLNYHFLAAGRWAPLPALCLLILAVALGLMVFVPSVGHAMGGKFRWLRLGPRQYSIGFQPSELIKIALVIFLACWLTRPGLNIRNPLVFLLGGLVTLGCMALVLTQDMGTALLIGISAGVVMFLAGVPWYYLAAAVALGGGAFYHLVAATPYRLQRVLVLLDPWSQTNPSAYQSQQSLIAILSGGWRGVGLGNGVRKLGFLPEDSTDFIFAGFCEEWGFRGAILLMGLMLIWTWNFRRAASRASEPLGRVLAASLGVMIVLQGLMHIAVNLVMLPPTGISMPFISAGGTALVLMAAAAAIIVSVTGHREGMTKPRIIGA